MNQCNRLRGGGGCFCCKPLQPDTALPLRFMAVPSAASQWPSEVCVASREAVVPIDAATVRGSDSSPRFLMGFPSFHLQAAILSSTSIAGLLNLPCFHLPELQGCSMRLLVENVYMRWVASYKIFQQLERSSLPTIAAFEHFQVTVSDQLFFFCFRFC